MSSGRRFGACSVGALAAVVVSVGFAAPAGAVSYLPPSQAPIKPGNYRAKASNGHFVLSPSRKAVAVLEGHRVHFQDFLFLTWHNPDGFACSMSAFEDVVISPPGLPDGVPAGLLDGGSGVPGGPITFRFHGKFAYRGNAKSKAKRRPNSINIVGTCNGITSTHLYTWSSP